MQFEVNLRNTLAMIALFVVSALAGYGLGHLIGCL